MPNTNTPTVIVTGSSGLIGTALTRRLAGPFRVFGLDVKPPAGWLPEGAAHVNLDLTDDASVRDALGEVDARREGPIASVIHLAAYYDFSGEPSPLYEQVTVRGTERLLRALKGRGAGQFVFSSTMLVHRPTEPGVPINEDSPLEARWDYPQSKLDTEALIGNEHGEIPAAILRIAGTYADTCDSIPLAQQIRRINERRLTARVFPGDVSHGQAFVHLDDLVEAVGRLVDQREKLPASTVLLIGEPETYSYDRLQRTLAELLHHEPDWDTEQIPKAIAKTGAWLQDKTPGVEEPFIKPWMIDLADDHYELDVDRARLLLDWSPRRRVLDTLSTMVGALREDPAAWYARHDLGEPPGD